MARFAAVEQADIAPAKGYWPAPSEFADEFLAAGAHGGIAGATGLVVNLPIDLANRKGALAEILGESGGAIEGEGVAVGVAEA